RDIESVSSNWDTSGDPADHSLNRGNMGEDADDFYPADPNDENGCTGIGFGSDPDDDCDKNWHINKRTHSLSNNEVIWDLSGNAYEWIWDTPSGYDEYGSYGGEDYVHLDPYAWEPAASKLRWGPAGDHLA